MLSDNSSFYQLGRMQHNAGNHAIQGPTEADCMLYRLSLRTLEWPDAVTPLQLRESVTPWPHVTRLYRPPTTGELHSTHINLVYSLTPPGAMKLAHSY